MPGTYVSVLKYKNNSCSEIKSEMKSMLNEAAILRTFLSKHKSSQDVKHMLGILFPLSWFFIDGEEAKE